MTGRISTEERYWRSFPEAWVQKQTEERLKVYGWWAFHAPDNRPGRNGAVQNITPGFPDIFAVRGKRILFLELKKQTEHPTDIQDAVLAMLQLTGKCEVHVIHPQQVMDGTLDAILKPEWQR